MTPFSPASQSVLDAFLADWEDEPRRQDRICLAAALRAVVDQVAPHADTPDPVFPKNQPNPLDDALMLVHNRTMLIRAEILAIAAEFVCEP